MVIHQKYPFTNKDLKVIFFCKHISDITLLMESYQQSITSSSFTSWFLRRWPWPHTLSSRKPQLEHILMAAARSAARAESPSHMLLCRKQKIFRTTQLNIYTTASLLTGVWCVHINLPNMWLYFFTMIPSTWMMASLVDLLFMWLMVGFSRSL